MNALLAPLLAELLTVNLGARTEGRYVFTRTDTQLNAHYEAAADAGVGFTFSVPYLTVAAGYAPGVTITPVGNPGTEVLLNDSLQASATTGYSHRFRRGSLTFTQSASYLLSNPLLQSLSGPSLLPPTATPPSGASPSPSDGGGATPPSDAGPSPSERVNEAATTTQAFDYRMQSWALRSQLAYQREMSRDTSFNAAAGYGLGAGLGERSYDDYPLTQGPDLSLALTYRATRRHSFTSLFTSQYSFNESGNHGLIASLSENWGYSISRRASSGLGFGVAYTASHEPEGPIAHSIFPTANAGFTYSNRLARGMFTFTAGLGAQPVLDVTTASVDPRLGTGVGAAWTRRRLSLSAAFDSAISLSGTDDEGTLNSINGSLVLSYQLGAGFNFDTGMRAAWQTFEGVTTVPPAFTAFVGISWAANLPVLGRDAPVR